MSGTARAALLVLLFLSTLINYLDRTVLAVLAPELMRQFSMPASQYGVIIAAFMLAYTLGQLGAGWLSDRLGPRVALALAMLWWSLAGMAHAAVTVPLGFLACRFALGLGEAVNWPAAVKAVGQWFSPPARASAVGFFNAGSTLGALLAPPVVVWFYLHYGWRNAFLLVGGLGLLWLPFWWILSRTQPEPEPEQAPGAVQDPQSGHGAPLLARPEVWGVVLARFFADSVWWFYVSWLPIYLAKARGVSMADIGKLAMIPYATAVAGNLLGGYPPTAMASATRPLLGERIRFMTLCAVAMAAGCFAPTVSTVTACLALVSLVTFAYSAWAANILTLPTDIVPRLQVGRVAGMAGFAAGLGGTLSNLLVGIVVERFGYGPVFTAAAASPVLAAACLLLLVKSSSPYQHQPVE
jgi:ACS family hexuronate transporter-like MFS transporter